MIHLFAFAFILYCVFKFFERRQFGIAFDFGLDTFANFANGVVTRHYLIYLFIVAFWIAYCVNFSIGAYDQCLALSHNKTMHSLNGNMEGGCGHSHARGTCSWCGRNHRVKFCTGVFKIDVPFFYRGHDNNGDFLARFFVGIEFNLRAEWQFPPEIFEKEIDEVGWVVSEEKFVKCVTVCLVSFFRKWTLDKQRCVASGAQCLKDALYDFDGVNWKAFAAKVHNRLMHALNGNILGDDFANAVLVPKMKKFVESGSLDEHISFFIDAFYDGVYCPEDVSIYECFRQIRTGYDERVAEARNRLMHAGNGNIFMIHLCKIDSIPADFVPVNRELWQDLDHALLCVRAFLCEEMRRKKKVWLGSDCYLSRYLIAELVDFYLECIGFDVSDDAEAYAYARVQAFLQDDFLTSDEPSEHFDTLTGVAMMVDFSYQTAYSPDDYHYFLGSWGKFHLWNVPFVVGLRICDGMERDGYDVRQTRLYFQDMIREVNVWAECAEFARSKKLRKVPKPFVRSDCWLGVLRGIHKSCVRKIVGFPQMKRVDEVKCARAHRKVFVERKEKREFWRATRKCESIERLRVRRQVFSEPKEAELAYFGPFMDRLYGVDYDVCEAVVYGFPPERVLDATGKPFTKRQFTKAVKHLNLVVSAMKRTVVASPQMGWLSDYSDKLKEISTTILTALENFNNLIEVGRGSLASLQDSVLAEFDWTFAGIRSFLSFIIDLVKCFVDKGASLALHLANMTLRYVVPSAHLIFTVLRQLFQVDVEIIDGVRIETKRGFFGTYSEGTTIFEEEDSRDEDMYYRDAKGKERVKAKPQGGKVIDEALVYTVVRFVRSLIFGGDLSDTRARADVITKTMQTALTGKNFFLLMKDAFEYVVNTFGEPPISKPLRDDLLDWQKDVMTLLTFSAVDMNLQRAEMVLALYARMRDLAKRVGLEKMKIEHLNFLPSTINKLNTYYASACAYKRVTPVRAEPVGILFCGLPGIGKSQCAGSYILTSVIGALGVVRDRTDIYTRNPKDPWFDGMSSNCIGVVYDDAGVLEDQTIRTTEQMEAMGMISSAPYLCPAAALDLKASHCFEGYMVIFNCNKAQVMTKGMNTPNALWRRLTLVEVELTDEKNYDPVVKRAIEYSPVYDHLRFTVFNVDQAAGAQELKKIVAKSDGKDLVKLKFEELCEYTSKQILAKISKADATLKSSLPEVVGKRINAKMSAKPQMFSTLFDKLKGGDKGKEKDLKRTTSHEDESSPADENLAVELEVVNLCVRQKTVVSHTVVREVLEKSRPLEMVKLGEYYALVRSTMESVPTPDEDVEKQKKLFEFPEDDPKWMKWIKTYWKPAAMLLTAAVAIGTSLLVAHFWNNDDDNEEGEPQSAYSRTVPASHARRYEGARRKAQAAKPQMSYRESDTGLEVTPIGPNDLIHGNPQIANINMIQKLAKVRGNLVHVEVCVEGDTVIETFGAIGLFTKGTKCMTAAHMLGGIEELLKSGISKEKIILRLTRNKAVWDFRYSECRFVICDRYEEVADVGFIYFPAGPVGPLPDIEHFFPSKVMSNELIDLYHVVPDEFVGDATYLIKSELAEIYGRSVETTVGGRMFVTVNAVVSSGIDGDGYCGIPMVCMNPKVPWFVLGPHFAALAHGGKARTLTAMVTQEFLKDVDNAAVGIPQFKLDIEDVMADWVYEERGESKTFPSNMMVLGHVKKQFMVSKSRPSKIVPSLIYDINESTHAPAQLVPIMRGDMKIRPFDQVAEKWSAPPFLTDPEDEIYFRMANEHIRSRVMDQPPRLFRTLSLYDELNTVPSLEKGSVNVRASLGHPMKHKFKGKGKNAAVHMDAELRFAMAPDAADYLRKVVHQLHDGVVTNLFYEIVMKDELRELPKVDKPRGFAAGSYALNAIGEMFYSQFLECFRNTERGLCIGTDMTGTEVLGVYEKFIIPFGKDAIFHAEDTERNDTRFRRRFITDFFKMADDYYAKYLDPDSPHYVKIIDEKCPVLGIPLTGKEGYVFACKVRRTIAKLVESPYCVWGDRLVQMIDKLISGVFCTIHINGYGNLFTTYVSVFKSFTKHGYRINPSNVDEFGRFAAIGDDVVGCIKPEYPFFTQNENAVVTRETFDRNLTSVSNKTKPGELGEIHLAPLDGDDKGAVTFMKRFFVERNHQLFAPLQMNVIREIPNWVNEDNRPMGERTREVAEAAIREWFFWGPEVFKREKEKINLRLHKAKLDPINLEFVTLLADWARRH